MHPIFKTLLNKAQHYVQQPSDFVKDARALPSKSKAIVLVSAVTLIWVPSLMSGPDVPERLVIDESLLDGKFNLYRTELPDMEAAEAAGGEELLRAQMSMIAPILCTGMVDKFDHKNVLTRGNRNHNTRNLARPYTGYAQFEVDGDEIVFPEYGYQEGDYGRVRFETVDFEDREVTVLVLAFDEVEMDGNVIDAYECQYPVAEYKAPSEPSEGLKHMQQVNACMMPVVALGGIAKENYQGFVRIAKAAGLAPTELSKKMLQIQDIYRSWVQSPDTKLFTAEFESEVMSMADSVFARTGDLLKSGSEEVITLELEIISEKCGTPPDVWGA